MLKSEEVPNAELIFAGYSQMREVVMIDSPRRRIMGQHLPGAAAADNIEVAGQFHAEHAWRDGYQRFQLVPFGVGQIGIVAITGLHPVSRSDTFSNAF
jgi:hypothetical protein